MYHFAFWILILFFFYLVLPGYSQIIRFFNEQILSLLTICMFSGLGFGQLIFTFY